jgi:hypothetical protein
MDHGGRRGSPKLDPDPDPDPKSSIDGELINARRNARTAFGGLSGLRRNIRCLRATGSPSPRPSCPASSKRSPQRISRVWRRWWLLGFDLADDAEASYAADSSLVALAGDAA